MAYSYIVNNFDFDIPSCLFCKKYLGISNTSHKNTSLDSYECSFCNEKFLFLYTDDKLTYIYFSCFDLEITIFPSRQGYFLSSKSKDNFSIKIPEFTIDFSDKQKLFEKLNTYIIFS